MECDTCGMYARDCRCVERSAGPSPQLKLAGQTASELIAEAVEQERAASARERARKLREAAAARAEARAMPRMQLVDDAAEMLRLFSLQVELGKLSADCVIDVYREAGGRWLALNGPERVLAMRRSGMDTWRCYFALGLLAASKPRECEEQGAALAVALGKARSAPIWIRAEMERRS